VLTGMRRQRSQAVDLMSVMSEQQRAARDQNAL
jgi:hypothetical protein